AILPSSVSARWPDGIARSASLAHRLEQAVATLRRPDAVRAGLSRVLRRGLEGPRAPVRRSPGARVSRHRACRAKIGFAKLRAGKVIPVENAERESTASSSHP